MKSARVGYTQILLAFLGYRIAHDPANILMARPTIDDAKKFMKEHVAEVLRWKVMKSLGFLRAVAGTANDTTTEKYFPGGSLKGIGANSPGGFRDHDADVVLSDEVDGFPITAGVDGDQLALIAKRLAQSHDPKDIAGSTPTEESISKIYRRFLESDQRYYEVPCPTCKTHQRLVWGSGKENEPGIKWLPFKEPTEIFYQCVNGCKIPEAKKLSMLKKGFWKALKPEVYQRTGHAGFHINSIYSLQPNGKWKNLVEEFLAAYKSPLTLKTFINTVLGEVWQFKGEAPEWERLYHRRETRQAGFVPYGGCFLTAAVDIQAANGGRLEVFVYAWGRGFTSYLVEHKVIPGSPFEADVWNQLTDFTRGKWQHENGETMVIEHVGVDVGYATLPAYRWCKKNNLNWAIPIRGSKDLLAPAIAQSKALELENGRAASSKTTTVRVHLVGGHVLKEELYAYLRLEQPKDGEPFPLGWVHLPTFVDDEFCKQLVAEDWIEEKNEWRKTGPNEALDGWCYNRAMANKRGADKWSEAQWAMLEARFCAPEHDVADLPEEQIIHHQPAAETQTSRAEELEPQVRQSPRRGSWLRR